MTVSDGTAVEPARPKGKALIWVGIVMMLAGAVIAGFSGYQAVAGSGVIDTMTAPTIGVPGTVTQSLQPGRYVVYEGIGYTSQYGGNRSGRLTPSDITISGPGGPVQVDSVSMMETVTRGNNTYVGVAAFDANSAGDYRITIASDSPGQVIVGPGLGSSFGRAFGWLLALGFGALVGLVGLVLLIVGVVKRSRKPRSAPTAVAGFGAAGVAPAVPGAAPAVAPPAPPAAPTAAAAPAPATTPPAGWYPAPDEPGRQRFWDGQAWTEHRA